MKKLLVFYSVLAVLWLSAYFVLILNSYVTIKYEVETIDNDTIVDTIYQVFDIGVVLNMIWFIVSALLFFFIYLKSRKGNNCIQQDNPHSMV